MADKNKVDVLIAGRTYTIAGYESDEYIQRVGLLVDRKLGEAARANPTLSTSIAAVLAAINVADDYYKARESELNIRKDLLSARIEVERARQEIAALEARNQDLSQRYEQSKGDVAKKEVEIAELRGEMSARRR